MWVGECLALTLLRLCVTTGKRYAAVNRLDGALFAGDDWNISSHSTASYGVRFESQNASTITLTGRRVWELPGSWGILNK